MAGKLSEIRASSPAATITGTELVEVTQGGATKAATVAELLALQSLDGLSDVTVTSAAQGAILYRASSGWVHLAAGTSGQVLTTAGAGANPSWATPASGGGSGTVTSVALSLPADLTVSGSPVTSSGTLSAAWATQTAGKVLAAPATATGAPSFRTLAATDLPSHTHPEAARIGINNQTGTTYTAVLTDAGKMVRCSNASAIALTLPTGGVYTVGDVVMVRQVGAGQITASGGTINVPTGVSAKTRAQGSVMSLHYVATDTWDASGDLA
jgi:hypothetical protein